MTAARHRRRVDRRFGRIDRAPRQKRDENRPVDYEVDDERSADEGGERIDERRLKVRRSSARRVYAGADCVGYRVDAN